MAVFAGLCTVLIFISNIHIFVLPKEKCFKLTPMLSFRLANILAIIAPFRGAILNTPMLASVASIADNV